MLRAMKLHILSDLHLDVSAMDAPRSDADVVVLAGDIGRPPHALAWALRLAKPVVYVVGNHEFYGGHIDRTVAELKVLCAGTPVQVLDDEALVIGGVRFLGSTLWTDFELFADPAAKAAAIAAAQRRMRDFSRIRGGDAAQDAFTPADAAARFERHAAWLERNLALAHAGPTVVITHHAPSRQSIHPRFAGDPLNACFVSDAEHLAGAERVQLWIHGHTHDSFDYDVNGTRVVCNPRGYARDGVNENPRFDPNLVIEIGSESRPAQRSTP
jgi:predicted phosphodiesterase